MLALGSEAKRQLEEIQKPLTPKPAPAGVTFDKVFGMEPAYRAADPLAGPYFWCAGVNTEGRGDWVGAQASPRPVPLRRA